MKIIASKNVLVLIFLVFLSVAGQSQFIAIARKIKSMSAGKTDVATVILDAGAASVFRAMTDTLSSDPKFSDIQPDPVRRMVKFSKGNCSITMKVDSIAEGASQITVAAENPPDTQPGQADLAVDAILRVCHKAGIKCTVDKP